MTSYFTGSEYDVIIFTTSTFSLPLFTCTNYYLFCSLFFGLHIFLLGTANDYSFCSLISDYIFFCWARQVIICFVVCFRTTQLFVGHRKRLFVSQSVFGLHIFLLATARDYLFRTLFSDYIYFCWALQVIICFVVCFRTTQFFVGHCK